MIPAILSCLYVIYLYRMLNGSSVDSPSERTSESLSDRVTRIQARIDVIAQESKT